MDGTQDGDAARFYVEGLELSGNITVAADESIGARVAVEPAPPYAGLPPIHLSKGVVRAAGLRLHQPKPGTIVDVTITRRRAGPNVEHWWATSVSRPHGRVPSPPRPPGVICSPLMWTDLVGSYLAAIGRLRSPSSKRQDRNTSCTPHVGRDRVSSSLADDRGSELALIAEKVPQCVRGLVGRRISVNNAHIRAWHPR